MRARTAIVLLAVAAAAFLAVRTGPVRPGSPPPERPASPEASPAPLSAPPAPASPPAPEPAAPDAPVLGAPAAPGLPLDLEIVDGETGQRFGPAAFEVSGPPLLPGERGERLLAIDVPPGWLLDRPGPVRLGGAVSAFAARLAATVPLYREASVVVRVEEADGTPAAGAEIMEVLLGGERRPFEAASAGASGEIRVRGVPALDGEPIRVSATKDGRWATSAPGRLGPPGMPVEVRVVLPDRASRRLVPGGGGSATSTVRIGGRESPGAGRIEVAVRRADGSPGAGARVRLSPSVREVRADGQGVAVFTGLREGPRAVEVLEPGFLAPGPVEVEVRDGGAVRVEVREEPGATLLLTVLDDAGRPVPFARIAVDDRGEVPYALLDGDVQRLTLLTDLEGRIPLPGLPDGGVRVSAAFGSRRAAGVSEPGTPLVLHLPPE